MKFVNMLLLRKEWHRFLSRELGSTWVYTSPNETKFRGTTRNSFRYGFLKKAGSSFLAFCNPIGVKKRGQKSWCDLKDCSSFFPQGFYTSFLKKAGGGIRIE